MKSIAVVCAPGIGDALIMHIVSHHLTGAGYEVTTVTPHRFGRWLADYRFGELGTFDLGAPDAIFLQHDNSLRAKEIQELNRPVYTFYGSHVLAKHGPLRPGFDYVSDPNRTMVENVVTAIRLLFKISATADNGFKPPPALLHRRYKKRVAINDVSASPNRDWPRAKFLKFAHWLEKEGYEPLFLPRFPTLEELASFLYESGYFMGNDSGPGHLASCLKIPHLIIGRCARLMRHWRPGWSTGEIVVPPSWVPNWKGFRLRENHWKKLISAKKVINRFKDNVLNN